MEAPKNTHFLMFHAYDNLEVPEDLANFQGIPWPKMLRTTVLKWCVNLLMMCIEYSVALIMLTIVMICHFKWRSVVVIFVEWQHFVVLLWLNDISLLFRALLAFFHWWEPFCFVESWTMIERKLPPWDIDWSMIARTNHLCFQNNVT